MVATKNNATSNHVRHKGDDHNQQALVYGRRLSSVGPATVTGDLIYEPSNIDLAMKLHYLRFVYFFDTQAAEGMTTPKLKEAVFTWLDYYYESCGRFRRAEDTGRPYIKCNDCGVRFAEAKSSKTLEEWLQLGDSTSSQRLLLPQDHVLGPELTFSPTVLIQITNLKCGGMAVGLSWSHVLGDAISALGYMRTLGQIIKCKEPAHPPSYKKPSSNIPKPTKQVTTSPLSVMKVGPVGDHWINPTSCEMDTFSFHLKSPQLALLEAKLSSPARPFDLITAVLWQAFAKVRPGLKTNTVTLIKPSIPSSAVHDTLLKNDQVICSVKADFPVLEAHLRELVKVIRDSGQDERAQIADMVDQDPIESDLILYGTKPTFVDLGEAALYGFEMKGFEPKLVNCFVDEIGEEGVVMVLPTPKNDKNIKYVNDERIVTLIYPKSYMDDLKEVLRMDFDLFA